MYQALFYLDKRRAYIIRRVSSHLALNADSEVSRNLRRYCQGGSLALPSATQNQGCYSSTKGVIDPNEPTFIGLCQGLPLDHI
jgi:hypothetical protein